MCTRSINVCGECSQAQCIKAWRSLCDTTGQILAGLNAIEKFSDADMFAIRDAVANFTLGIAESLAPHANVDGIQILSWVTFTDCVNDELR